MPGLRLGLGLGLRPRTPVTGGGGPVMPSDPAILTETNDVLLLESGERLLLE